MAFFSGGDGGSSCFELVSLGESSTGEVEGIGSIDETAVLLVCVVPAS
jgi:hypothetical protein